MMKDLAIEIGFSLGSNLGNRTANLAEAKRQILRDPHASLLAQSALYATDPVEVAPQHTHLGFLNAVLVIASTWPVEAWLAKISTIEEALHRERTPGVRNQPRPIDIDIVYAGDSRIESEGLVIPHPRWAHRRFVLAPLAEVRPTMILPGTTKTVMDLLTSLDDPSGCARLPDPW